MPCRCLLDELPDQAALLRSIEELVSLLPPDLRADDDVKASRLSVCRTCPHLVDGMCALCGCYVQLRAARAAMSCPDVPPRWDRRTVTDN